MCNGAAVVASAFKWLTDPLDPTPDEWAGIVVWVIFWVTFSTFALGWLWRKANGLRRRRARPGRSL
jgi:hypothetical protein